MKINSIKWKILKYNIIIIVLLVALTTVIFNIAVRMYFEKDILKQLNKVATHIEETALQHGPDFFPVPGKEPPPKPQTTNDIYRFYFMLDRSSKESITVLNADYILLDRNKELITPPPKNLYNPPDDTLNKIISKIGNLENFQGEKQVKFYSFHYFYFFLHYNYHIFFLFI